MESSIYRNLAIVIAVKNGEQTIQNCLDSLSPVIKRGAALYVFDSCSDDGTQDIINAAYPFADYRCKKDKGLYYAWNDAVYAVDEPFVFFINADDTLVSSRNLEKLVENLLTDPNLVASSGKTVMVRQDGVKRVSGQRLKKDWFVGDMPIVTPATVFNVKSLRLIKGFDTQYSISADYEMMLRLLRKNGVERFKFSDLEIVNFSLDGMSNVSHYKAFSEIRSIVLTRLGLAKYCQHVCWYVIHTLKRWLLLLYFKI